MKTRPSTASATEPGRTAAFLGVRPGEGAVALLFFLYFFLVTAPFSIVKSVRDASYLDDVGVQHLPWAYATAALVAAAVALHARLQARLERRLLLVGSLVFFAATALIFRALLDLEWPGLSLLYWLWANIFVVVLTTQFWFLVNDRFDPRQAKRLVGFLGSGGILGGIAGGLLTGYLARPESPEDLLYVAAALLLAGAAVVAVLFRRLDRSAEGAPARPAAAAGFVDSLRTVRGDSYLRLLAALAVLAGIVSTFIDWQSKAVIITVPAAKINLAAFFGRFNAALLLLTFVFQLALTSRFLGRFGLRAGLMVYPLARLACTGGVAAWPVLGWALAVKGSDKALSYSIHQSARELLYIPVSADRKYRAKVFIDMFLNRFSKTIGAGLLLAVFLLPGGRDIRVVSIVSAGLLLLWLGLNLKLGRAYGESVKEHLGQKWAPGEGLVGELADADSAKAILDALESRQRSPSLYALHLYDLARTGRLTPEILRFLDEESRALAAPAANPLLDAAASAWIPGPEAELASAGTAIREILDLPEYQKVMGDYAAGVLRDGGGDETARMELAKVAGLMNPRSPLAARVDDLILDGSPEVVHLAVAAAGRLRRRSSVPLLLARLGDPRFRADAEEALTAFGAAVAGTLGDALVDPAEPLDVRRGAAAVLSATADQDCAAALLDGLAAADPALDRDLTDALSRLRSEDARLCFDPDVVRAAAARELDRLEKARTRAEGRWLFKLFGLLVCDKDLARAGQNFAGGTAAEAVYALELLDNVLPLEWKERALPVLERLTRSEGCA